MIRVLAAFTVLTALAACEAEMGENLLDRGNANFMEIAPK